MQINKVERGLPENRGLKAGDFGVLNHEARIKQAERHPATYVGLNWKSAYLKWCDEHGGPKMKEALHVGLGTVALVAALVATVNFSQVQNPIEREAPAALPACLYRRLLGRSSARRRVADDPRAMGYMCFQRQRAGSVPGKRQPPLSISSSPRWRGCLTWWDATRNRVPNGALLLLPCLLSQHAHRRAGADADSSYACVLSSPVCVCAPIEGIHRRHHRVDTMDDNLLVRRDLLPCRSAL